MTGQLGLSGKGPEALPALAHVNEGKHATSPERYTTCRLATLPEQVAPTAGAFPLFIFLLALLLSHALHDSMQICIPLPASMQIYSGKKLLYNHAFASEPSIQRFPTG